ncbi:MAG: serine acetyltransferase, partial [Microbacterium sp.]
MSRAGLVARAREDIAAAKLRDPAARGSVELALLYPGLHAIWA